ncbi:MAG: hypothetical protein HOQ24_08980 [Mycobacteriaceae bacterium]|nr:hypothetical protein [Mycobacteriaceae bacterium]
MTTTQHPTAPTAAELTKVIGKRSFCTIATSSPKQRSHAAGVLYEAVGTDIYINTDRDSRKVRNVVENPHVGVVIPVRRAPVGPPSEIQFQGAAEVFAMDDPHIRGLLDQGKLKSITSHGELDRPNGCFIRIVPNRRIHTYGLGMSLIQLIRDPLNAAGVVELA